MIEPDNRELIGYKTLITVILCFHFYLFNKIPLQFDELLMYNVVSGFNYTGIVKHLMTIEIQMPLAYFMTKGMISVFGDSSFFLRLPSLLFTLVLPFSFYRLCRASLSEMDSLKAVCVFLMFHPVFIFSGSVRPYVFLVLLFIMVLTRLKQFLTVEKPLTYFNKFTMGLLLFLLAIVHPIGLGVSLISLGVMIYKGSRNQISLVIYIGICLFFMGGVYLYRYQDLVYIFKDKINLGNLVKYAKNISFLSSGGLFTIALLLLTSILSRKFYRNRNSLKNFDKFHIGLLLCLITAGAISSVFLNKYTYPRHLILCLPSLAILIIQLINELTDNQAVRKGIFIVLLCILYSKTFLQERLQDVPYEIDSIGMSEMAMKLSNGKRAILNCGNCFSYYIKSKKLECTGVKLRVLNEAEIKEEIIFMSVNYSESACKVNQLVRFFKVLEIHNFKGGDVYKLIPKNN